MRRKSVDLRRMRRGGDRKTSKTIMSFHTSSRRKSIRLTIWVKGMNKWLI
jgi:hypothetical protein